jgi:GT2 family glycosyltransferase
VAEKVKIAAVILNYNDNENTLRLVKDFEGFDFISRVVVADNSGKTGLKSLNESKATLLRLANSGYAAGNNAGLALIDKDGGADFIIISNPDVFVTEDAVAACVDFLQNHKDYALAAPRMFTVDGKPHHLSGWQERTFLCDFAYSSGILSRLVGMCRECYPESYFKRPFSDVDCVAGSFFVIRASIFKQAGYFDEHTFLYYEEDILGFKLKRLGFKSAVINSIRFIHCEGTSVNKSMNYLRRYLTMQKSRLYFHRHYKKTSLPKYTALCLATGLGMVEKSAKTVIYRLRHV